MGFPVIAATVWSVDFESSSPGATSGNNQTLEGSDVQTANGLSGVVVDLDALGNEALKSNFSLGSGNVYLLSDDGNQYAAIRSASNPITGFGSVEPNDTFSFSFDLYIPQNLALAVGDIQPRLELAGTAGNGPSLESQTVQAAGQYHVVYTGLVSSIINPQSPDSADSARPFIGFNQNEITGGTTYSNIVYIDNIDFQITPSVPVVQGETLVNIRDLNALQEIRGALSVNNKHQLNATYSWTGDGPLNASNGLLLYDWILNVQNLDLDGVGGDNDEVTVTVQISGDNGGDASQYLSHRFEYGGRIGYVVHSGIGGSLNAGESISFSGGAVTYRLNGGADQDGTFVGWAAPWYVAHSPGEIAINGVTTEFLTGTDPTVTFTANSGDYRVTSLGFDVSVDIDLPTNPPLIKASAPVPADGAELVPFDAVLWWGDETTNSSYQIYFGTSFDDVDLRAASTDRGSVENNTFNPHGLSYGTTYYWAVDTTEGGMLSSGDVWSFTTEAAPANRPNVIFIMADDLSHYGISAYGTSTVMRTTDNANLPPTLVSTPRIDSLAHSGMLFSSCHTPPLCEPTRVALMSGVSNARNFTGHRELSETTVTFGDLFKKAGYATCLSGKWKQGGDYQTIFNFGFDEYCAFDLNGVGNRYKNPRLVINGVVNNYSGGEYGPQICNDFVLDFIDRNTNNPFFVYYPLILVHNPTLPTPDSAPADYSANTEHDRFFADMVAYMDKVVGNVLDKLDEHGLRENTLVIFAGDNGTAGGFTYDLADGTAYEGGKGKDRDHGTHVPLLVSQPGTVLSGPGNEAFVNDDLVHLYDVFPTMCEAAGISLPPNKEIDARSFYPQLLGTVGNPRPYLFHHYSPQGSDFAVDLPSELSMYAWTHDYKLYSNGRFFDLQADLYETNALDTASLTIGQQAAYDMLEEALAEWQYQQVTGMSLAQGNLSMLPGQRLQAKAVVLPENTTRVAVKWASGNEGVATVDKYGIVTAVTSGMATITARSYDQLSPMNFTVTVDEPALDSLGDGIPDAWRADFFGGDGTVVSNGYSDANGNPDGDDYTNEEEFLLGLNPLVADSVFEPVFQTDPGDMALIVGLPPPPAGDAYAGRRRYFTLETNSNLVNGTWAHVPGFLNVEGEGLDVEVALPSEPNDMFFRLQTTLE